MKLLSHQLRPCLANRVCLVGVGNPRSGDGAVGFRVAEALSSSHLETPQDPQPSAAPPTLESAERSFAKGRNPPPPLSSPSNQVEGSAPRTSIAILKAADGPQQILSEIVQGEFDHVVFIEALDFGGPPGDVVVLGRDEIATGYRPPSAPTDSFASLTQVIEANGKTKSWLLGVQPASWKQDRPLSRSVACTVQALVSLLAQKSIPRIDQSELKADKWLP